MASWVLDDDFWNKIKTLPDGHVDTVTKAEGDKAKEAEAASKAANNQLQKFVDYFNSSHIPIIEQWSIEYNTTSDQPKQFIIVQPQLSATTISSWGSHATYNTIPDLYVSDDSAWDAIGTTELCTCGALPKFKSPKLYCKHCWINWYVATVAVQKDLSDQAIDELRKRTTAAIAGF